MALTANSRVQHNRKLVMGGSALTMARLRGKKHMEAHGAVREELEREIISSGYLEGAPFDFVGLMIRYGLKYDDKPEIRGISKRYLALDLAIEVDVRDMLEADYDGLVAIFRKATLIALIGGGKKHGLKTHRLEELLAEMEEAA